MSETKGQGLAVRYAQWVVRWRWWVLLATLLATVAAAAGASKLSFTNDYRVFFSDRNPELTAFDKFQDIYTKTDTILFAVKPKEAPANLGVFTNDTLAAVKELTEESWKIPYSIRVDSPTNFQHTEATEDDLVVADLVKNPGSLDRKTLMKDRKVALEEPSLVNRLVAKDGMTAGVLVTLQLPGKDPDEVLDSVSHAEKLLDRIKADYPNLDVVISGIAPLSASFPRASMQDMETLIPIMYLALIVAMGIFLRSVSGTIATVLVVGMSAVFAMGSGGWLGVQLTPPSAMAPTIILTIAIADCVHILVSMFQQMRKGLGKHEALIESLRLNTEPVFLTSLTTVIGFMSLNFSDSPPFADLGNLSAIGVAAAWVYAMTFLPALMAILPVRVKKVDEDKLVFMDRMADFVVNRRKALIWQLGLVIVVLLAFVPTINLDDRFVEYFDYSVPIRGDTEFVADNLTGPYQIEFSVGAANAGGIADPAYLNHLENFANWLRQQPGVMHVNSFTDVMKRLSKSMHADKEDWYRLPNDRQLAAQYLLLYEMSLPYGLDLNSQINVDKSATRLTATIDSIGTTKQRELKARAEEWLVQNTPPYMHASATGTTVMFAYISERNIKSMLTGTVLAFLLISASLMFALRSLRLSLISIIPNLVPAGIAFGIWGIFVGEMGLAASVITATSLGLIVDATVHILSKYNRARREKGYDAEAAVRYSFSTVGTALWVTTAILVAGFAVLAFSSFKINAEMGLLTAIAITAAIFVDFFLLPPLLLALDRRRVVRGASEPVPAE